MAENQNGAEKTELPTPKRLADARAEGQVAFSMEVTTAALLLGGLTMLAFMGPWFCEAVGDSLRYACGEGLRVELTNTEAVREMIRHHGPLGAWALTLIAALFVIGVVASVAQVGFNLSLKAIQPKGNKINPITGFGRLFGLRGWVRLGLGVMKLLALAGLGWWLIHGDFMAYAMVPVDLRQRLGLDADRVWWTGIFLVASLAVIALADALFQRFQHQRDLMMTRQELREEFKQSDGDPHLKARIRQLQREVAGRRMMQEVPKADVIITNPTHVAVALRYAQGKDGAPLVIAKGYDAVAQRIKAIAAEHGIPMIEDIPLARALAAEVPLGRAIPVKWYQAVAKILAALYAKKPAATT